MADINVSLQNLSFEETKTLFPKLCEKMKRMRALTVNSKGEIISKGEFDHLDRTISQIRALKGSPNVLDVSSILVLQSTLKNNFPLLYHA